MALIDDLISQVHDERVRGQLKRALAEIRRRKKFGLVFEEHIPETALLAGAGIHQGSQVMLRREPTNGTRYFIRQLDGKVASISIAEDAPVKKVPLNDLLVIKPFGEAVYPVLQQTGSVERGLDRPYHVVINGENFHALQLLLFAYEGEIDCIYIDPPYNTGARDWKYNNNYVDSNDSWRHSKWLSFMEKRLKLARQLLKRDGILIVTIDEHEVSNLGVLLRQIFSQARVQMITIVTNTAGSMSPGLFSRAEEYAYFCFFGDSKPSPMEWDMLAGSKPETQFWFPLFRSRGIDDRPSRRPNLVYPIAVDPESLTISQGTCGCR
jgi:adenine-specific DNA-methyltransferase